jgi:hypothetical protein
MMVARLCLAVLLLLHERLLVSLLMMVGSVVVRGLAFRLPVMQGIFEACEALRISHQCLYCFGIHRLKEVCELVVRSSLLQQLHKTLLLDVFKCLRIALRLNDTRDQRV